MTLQMPFSIAHLCRLRGSHCWRCRPRMTGIRHQFPEPCAPAIVGRSHVCVGKGDGHVCAALLLFPALQKARPLHVWPESAFVTPSYLGTVMQGRMQGGQ